MRSSLSPESPAAGRGDRVGAGGAPRCLVADVGGTHLRLALVDPAAAQPLAGAPHVRWRTADFPDPGSAARAFLDELRERPRCALFAIAGPVSPEGVTMTNRSWRVDRRALAAELGLERLELVNDCAAAAMALAVLAPGDLQPLGNAEADKRGADDGAPRVLVAPGTGLGVGALLQRGGEAIALATEAGHVGFAPRDAAEVAILERLAARFGRVSNERLLSGAGLVNLHAALDQRAAEREPLPEDIMAAATAGDRRCLRSVELFCELLGAAAGDYVLALGGWGGLYLAGGMTPVLLPWLLQGGFRRRFEDKGRYAAWLACVPAFAVLHPEPGLLGACEMARRHFAGHRAGGAAAGHAARV